MMWWYEDVFINRNNPEKTLIMPKHTTDEKLQEKTLMLKINLLFTLLKKSYRNYLDLKTTQRALKALDDHLLHDIGLDRADWQALMDGQMIKRPPLQERLQQHTSTTLQGKSTRKALPGALPGVNRNIVTNAGKASNDCNACAA